MEDSSSTILISSEDKRGDSDITAVTQTQVRLGELLDGGGEVHGTLGPISTTLLKSSSEGGLRSLQLRMVSRPDGLLASGAEMVNLQRSGSQSKFHLLFRTPNKKAFAKLDTFKSHLPTSDYCNNRGESWLGSEMGQIVFSPNAFI